MTDQERLKLFDWIRENVGNIDFHVKTPPDVHSSNPWIATGGTFEDAIAKAKGMLEEAKSEVRRK